MEYPISFNIIVPEALETDKTLIPPMIIQPYVENAIRHGIAPLDRSGVIQITVTYNNESLLIHIDDDGVGRDSIHSSLSNLPSGTKVTQLRLEKLSGQSPNSFSVDFFDKKDAEGQSTGTIVKLKLPLKSKK